MVGSVLVILLTVAIVSKAAAAPPKVTPVPLTTAPPTTSPPATETAAPLVTQYVYPDYYGQAVAYRYGLPPLPGPPPPGWYVRQNMPAYELVPGASWPVLVGRDRDTVAAWLMTTYPRLTVRAVPYGSPVSYEPRNDRITVMYNQDSRRVVAARIG